MCVQSFFTKWWAEQSDEKRELVQQLVRNGQLDFVNGGWVQNDEASSAQLCHQHTLS